MSDIANATDHDIRNHCWFQLDKLAKKVDKGKGKAVDLSSNNAVAGPSGTRATEVKGDGSEVGEPRQTAMSAVVPEDQTGESSQVVNSEAIAVVKDAHLENEPSRSRESTAMMTLNKSHRIHGLSDQG